ncbi:MAG: PAS domain S-box protein, partial [Pseudomonadales bacterium]|nr:PAS domain S-box protein [Pseudomonadales bacterium]
MPASVDSRLKRREHLFFRIAKPILGFGIVFAALVLLVQGAQQEKNLTRELQDRAGILTTTFESLLVAASPEEALEVLAGHNEGGVGIARLALLNAQGSRVIASVPPDWSGALWTDIAELNPLIEGRHAWWLDGPSLQTLVLPASGPGLGSDSQLLVTLDGTLIVDKMHETLRASLLTTLVGVLMFALGASLIVRTQVLRPIDAIKDAVEKRRQGNVVPIPKLRDDEIGALAELLETSLAEGERLDDQLKLMSQAIQGSRNEVYIIDADDLRLHLANRSAQKNLGYTKEELTGMQVPEIARELQDEAYLSELAGYLATGGELTHRYTHTRKDGTVYPFEFTAIPVIQHKRAWLLVLGNDVTEKHAQEEALRASEERLKLAVQGSNDGVFDYDIESEELYLSERLRGWLELEDEDSGIQLPPIEWASSRVHEEDLSTVRMAVLSCLSEGQEFDTEFRFRNNSGVYRWMQVRGHSAKGETRETRRITGFVSDITRRKVAEILLKDTVSRLGAVLDNITDGIVTLNEAGEVCAINPACEVMLQVSRDVLISRPFAERLTIGQTGWDALADRQLRECVAARGEGDLFPVEFSVTRLDTGSDERFIVVFRDISQRKRAEDELHQAVARAQAATLAKGEFLATMSHEIRTPMNGVLGMTQLLMDMQLNEEQRETAEVIHASGEALLTIINDILDFSKVESGKLQFETMPFDLRVTIREVMDLLSANKRQIELYIDFARDVPGNLLGDLGRVRQVLMNLIGNAVKFTQEGSVVVRVTDEQADLQGSGLQQRTFARLKVSVKDTGCGIAERAQSRLFDSFTQADASTTRKHGGTGLGLAI